MKTITIHNLKDSTAQEVYDFIAHHLLTQNERVPVWQEGWSPTSRYKIEKNGKVLRCAVACLIPDECYQDKFASFFNIFYKVMKDYPRHSLLLISLQLLHDKSPVEHWSTELTGLARENGLIPL